MVGSVTVRRQAKQPVWKRLGSRAARRLRALWPPRYSLAGLIGTVAFASVSFTPSLLPRGWLLQAAFTGITAAVGYGVGVALGRLVRTLAGTSPSAKARRVSWLLLALLGIPVLAWTLWLGQDWQRRLHLLMGMPPPDPYAWLPMLAVASAALLLIIAAFRLLRWLVRALTAKLTPRVRPRVARALAVAVVFVLVAALANGLLWRALVNASGDAFGTPDRPVSEDVSMPLAPQRSGSPASLLPWDSLGRHGKNFVTSAPTVARLSEFSGAPAQRPVRIYAGLNSAPDVATRAALAVRDLRRAGGFDRKVLVVAQASGSGTVDPAAVQALEYMYNGDTAVVSMQYSFLPSWFSFVTDRQRAQQTGKELFDEVHRAWAALPAERRPKLLVTGTSLGAFGIEAAFDDLADVRGRTDGVVLAGPPSAGPLHQFLVNHRDPGSPQWLPVYDSGRTVRFASTSRDLWAPEARWQWPRMVYLQHGSDPVVFWDPEIAVARPDWLVEPRAPDVSPHLTWLPLFTFWQLTADLPYAQDVPPGHGHNYRALFADTWAAVAPPPGWTAADTLRLRSVLETIER
ncbi:alpha/beta hydrolase [Saccharomonospora marina]|uniref:alpha/beta hydrolase n=1 Tax=Saccharomonospora marina TaxID=632569 RepID=UPI0003159B3B|nr:alpha/beta-hydrolase family protein [Saccharomonospora marina]